ncbi:MAG TPA: alpha-L-fucosidase [Candidatus Kryptonia bacterium]|nr:alpha-L-fucosidase [Candidatus Kryptonia bacterium]
MSSWFEQARFGMFIHWGHVSQKGWELSWPMVGGTQALPASQDVPAAVYHESAYTFCPQPNSPRTWLEHAQRAGMRYAVFITKHHDGFALYPSKVSDFTIAQSKYRGDLVREYVDAARDLGLRVGLYFSLCDWHHPDYPPFTDADRPYRFGTAPRPTPEQWQRFRVYLFAQIRELLTHYGKIDLIWFDGGWERSAGEWHAQELHDLIRSLQPDILINDRLPGFGDFDTPEQFIPPQPPARRWETCMTMNETWGYNPSDTNYKSARELVHTLCEVAGRGGNLLLNVSPMGNGQLPPEQIDRLDALAGWMAAYRDSILDTEPGLESWQFYGPSTRKNNRVFLHLLLRPYDSVSVRGVRVKRVRAVRELRTGTALRYRTRCTVMDTLFNQDPQGELIIAVPEPLIDPLATVIEIEFER